jgi:hypothetical protein
VFLINYAILGLVVKPYLVVKIANYSIKSIMRMFFSCIKVTVAALILPLILFYTMDEGAVKFMTVGSVSVMCVLISAWLLGIDKNMRMRIVVIIRKKMADFVRRYRIHT